MSKLRVIQIGTGGFGKVWLRSVIGVQEVELKAVVDISEENLAAAKEIIAGTNIPTYSDYKQALREVPADFVLLITPPGTHHALMRDAVEAGLHVLMEKPVASELDDAAEMVKYAATCGKFVMVNQNYRWTPVVQALKNAVDSGIVGPIENVEWRFSRNHTSVNFSTGWRSQFDEILLKEMSIHHFDMLRYMLGKNAVSVYAESTNPSWSWIPSNAVATAQIHLEDNIFVNYYGSWVSRGKDTPWNGDIRLIGRKGVIQLLDDVPSIVFDDFSTQEIAVPEMKYSGVQYSVYDMVNAIRDNRLPVTHIADNLLSWELVCKAVESVKTKKRISIKA